MNKKFTFINETINVGDKVLYRIKALRDFSNVKSGDLGGFLENEDNLNHEGLCWVYDDACVYDYAKISDNARVRGSATVRGNAMVCDDARIGESAIVEQNAYVGCTACVVGTSCVTGHAEVLEYALVKGNAYITDNAYVSDNATVTGNAKLYNSCIVCNNAEVGGDVVMFDNASISTDGMVHNNTDYACIHVYSYEHDDMECEVYVTFYKLKDDEGTIVTDFEGKIYNLDEFRIMIDEKYSGELNLRFKDAARVAEQTIR